jgi:LemA protein
MKYAVLGIAALVLASVMAVWQFRLVRQELSARHQTIHAAWDDVEVGLRRRAELVPQLAALLQKVGNPDPDVVRRAELAAQQILAGHTPQEKIIAYTDLNTALVDLLITAHRSKEILRRSAFQVLNYELESDENRIAHSRSQYNDAVQKYNTKLRLFPANPA